MRDGKLYKNKSYMYLLVSNIINRAGDSIDTILFSWLVYTLTNSAGWSAIIFGVNQATSVIIQPFAGPLVDRLPKKKVLIITDYIRAFLVLGVMLIYLNDMLSPWILIMTTIAISLIEAFHMPAGVAIIQGILPKEDYDTGVSTNVSLTKIAILVGNGIAGLVISFLGIGIVLFLDFAVFLYPQSFLC